MNFGSFSLASRCISCRGRVTLEFTEWPENAVTGPDDPTQPWACPFCMASNHGQYPAQIARAVPWIEHDPESGC
jgi:hypothetical protein